MNPRPAVVTVPRVEVAGDEKSVTIMGSFSDPEIVTTYASLLPQERGDFAARAFKIGSTALRGLCTGAQTMDVEARFQRMEKDVLAGVTRFLGKDGDVEKRLHQIFAERGDLAKALNPNDKTTPLGFFMEDVRKMLVEMQKQTLAHLGEIKTGLAVEEATAREARRGTRQGLDFQNQVLALVADEAEPHGDRVEDVSTQPGQNGGKKGDIVSTINADDTGGIPHNITVEVKDTPIRSRTAFMRELDEALENRAADVALGVIEAEHALDIAPLYQAGPRTILVSVEKDCQHSVELRIAYRFARMLAAMRATSKPAEIDVASFQEGFEAIRRHLTNMRAIRQALKTASSNVMTAHLDLGTMAHDLLEEVANLEAKLNRSQQ